MQLTQSIHDAMFRRVHSSFLIYNTCWEDPVMDRQMLALGPDSRVVMITSAGCNALDYLLDSPAEIHAVDMNPRQNALLELKIAMIQHGNFAELRRVFGEGIRPGFRDLFREFSHRLSPYARAFWETKHTYFEASRTRTTFYYRGGAGRAALLFRKLVRFNPGTREFTENLMAAETVEEQRRIYELARPSLWNPVHSWVLSQPLVMAMMGVPRAQIRLVEDQFPGGIAGYLSDKIERLLAKLPMRHNYFWRVYMTGQYTPECCPNYLRPENQVPLRQRTSRVKTHNHTFARFLHLNPGRYTHFVLLDHQDWQASHDPAGLREEWELILKNSHPGTRILMRSASPEINFIPESARQRLRFFPEMVARLDSQDRVGTYGSTVLAEIQ